jgi:predicted metalloendopeptidase
LRAALPWSLALLATAAPALDIAGLARDVSPCEDLYAYANRQWIAATAIPVDRAEWGVFESLRKRNAERLEALLAAAAKSNPYPEGSNRHKVVAYFASGMDEAAIGRAKLAPLAPLFAAIDALKTVEELPAALAALHKAGISAAFQFTVRQDAKDSRRYLAQIQQAGLGLPDRDYYFREDKRSEEQREAYLKYFFAVTGLSGESARAGHYLAGSAIGIERLLAGKQMTLVERRDPEKTYNKRTVEALMKEAPGFDWKAYFAALGVPDLAEVNVAQPAYAAAFASMTHTFPAEDWRAYLRWRVLDATSSKLPSAFETAHFDFHGRVLAGLSEMPPRARRVVETISGRYGSEPLALALAEIFVADAFSPEAKQRAQALVGHVKTALRERLAALEWMEPETRRAALEKLDRMAVKIGYPDHWRDFSAAEVGARPFAENWLKANEFEFRRNLAKLGKPVDRDEWWMAPHVVNAYYASNLNEIVFPAGILQPPFFDPEADEAVNFGGIGMVIGHEITHGFDDRGRRYDAEGNLREWWASADRQRYRERAQATVRQYSAYPGADGIKVNGELTLGENLSDQGGLKIAFLGLQHALKDGTPKRIDGLSPEQRFFISFAQSWRANVRPERERTLLLTDGHSPARYRVNGSIAKMPEFARAFSCRTDPDIAGAAATSKNLW